MKLTEIRDGYQSGKFPKPSYINQMYDKHRVLFEYPELLKSSDVCSVTVDGEGVKVKFSTPPIEMCCAEGDVRTAPIEALNFGGYEKYEFEVLSRILDVLNATSPVFFDIGANAGFYSLGLSKLHSGLSAYAFEPIPSTYELLCKNIELNGLKNIQIHNIALSNHQGETVFYTYSSQSGASSSEKLLEDCDAHEVSCRLETLDSLAGKLPPVDLVKCDVEGAELHVFEGGVSTFSRDRPVIFTEMLRKWCSKFHYHPNAIISLLKGIGYQCYAINAAGLVNCPEVTDQTAETNFLFLHAEKESHLEIRKSLL